MQGSKKNIWIFSVTLIYPYWQFGFLADANGFMSPFLGRVMLTSFLQTNAWARDYLSEAHLRALCTRRPWDEANDGRTEQKSELMTFRMFFEQLMIRAQLL